MNFHEFQSEREARLAADPSLIDCGEMNLWRALAEFVPHYATDPPHKMHRCHLAQAWLETFGLPAADAPRALVSSGVRHSLSLIFAALAGREVRLHLPLDVYPVYGELASAAGLRWETFATLPEFQQPHGCRSEIHQQPDGCRSEILLLANPLKPAGRWLTNEEVEALTRWLAEDGARRLILDAVYTFDARFHATTIALLATGQTILLHSLSKGWLRPRVFGIALVPAADFDWLVPVFRAEAILQANLYEASQLLEMHAALPSRLAEQLERRRATLLSRLPDDVRDALLLPSGAERAGYLLAARASATELLEKHRLLAIPLSVFGSPRDDVCVLSTLAPEFITPGRSERRWSPEGNPRPRGA